MEVPILPLTNHMGISGHRSHPNMRQMLRQMLVLMVCQMATTTRHQPQIPLIIFAQVEFKSTWPRILRTLFSVQAMTEVITQFLLRKLHQPSC
jgi:hypothetical protein